LDLKPSTFNLELHQIFNTKHYLQTNHATYILITHFSDMSHAPAPTGSLSVSEAADEEALAADRKNVSSSNRDKDIN
jgi:hypothetical protein